MVVSVSLGPSPAASAGGAGPAFAYLIRMFPQTSETFIASEILRLERLGLPLRVYSCRRPVEKVEHESVRLIRSPVQYLPDPLWKQIPRIVKAMLTLRRADKRRFHRALAFALRRCWHDRSPEMGKRFAQAACLASELQAHKVRHVHAHFAHSATDVTLLASLLTGIPFSFTGHARDIYLSKPAALKEKIEAAEFVVTCTGANQRYLSEIAGAALRDKINLGYHGVDTEKFAWRETEPPAQPPLVLSVGRLVQKKGFPDFIDALHVLRGRGIDFRAMIVGAGPGRSDLEAQIRRLNLGEIVSLPGAVSQEALVDIYRRAAVFALPCRVLDDGDRDGLPNVLLESMSTGLPVVSSAISGIPEVIRHGDNGLLVPERDVNALASALELLLRDKELRRRLGRNARATIVSEMSAEAMTQKLASLFFGAVGLRPREVNGAVASSVVGETEV